MARTIVRGPLDFTAGDGTTLETLYSYFALITGTSTGYVGIKSNALTQLFGDVGVRYVYRDGGGTYTADQYSGGVIAGLGGFTFGYIGLTVCVSADTGSGADYYLLRIQDIAASGGNQATDIIKCVNGSSSTLDTRNISWSNGDAIFIEAVDNGANVDIHIYQGTGSTPRYTVTDSTSPLASGKPGTSTEQGATMSWDNVELGTVGGSSGSTGTAAGAATVSAAGKSDAATTATAATGAATVSGIGGTLVLLLSSAFKNNTGTLLASLTNVTVWINAVESGALVVKKTAQATDAAGQVTITDAAIVTATQYRVTYRNEVTGAWGSELLTAT